MARESRGTYQKLASHATPDAAVNYGEDFGPQFGVTVREEEAGSCGGPPSSCQLRVGLLNVVTLCHEKTTTLGM
jgi:hypothetical protein